MTPIHGLPNELVFELCREIQAVQMPDTILLTSINIHAYLADRYRKKLVYRDAIAFIKAKLNNGSGVAINIGRTRRLDEGGWAEIHQQWQSESGNVFELLTNQLCFQFQANGTENGSNLCLISEGALECADVRYLFRLIAPLIKPISLDLFYYRVATNLSSFLNSMSSLSDCIMIDAKQFLLEPIYTTLNNCYIKLRLDFYADLSGEQKQQLHRALIHWINENNDGQTKQCSLSYIECHEISLLVDEIKTDFCRSTSKHPLSSIRFFNPAFGEPEIEGFNVRNSAGEELEFGREMSDDFFSTPTLWFGVRSLNWRKPRKGRDH